MQDGQSSGPSLTAPSGDVLTGATISLSGSNFAPHATPQLSLCDADGNSCASNGFTANTLSIDAAGALTGTATVSPGSPTACTWSESSTGRVRQLHPSRSRTSCRPGRARRSAT
ncbi:hypothetical protein ACU686_06060 [Yinghuangia aomiensis]